MLRHTIPYIVVVSTLLVACDPVDGGVVEDHATCDGEPELLSFNAPQTLAPGEAFDVAFEVHNFEFTMAGQEHEDQPHDEDDSSGSDEHDDPTSGCIAGHVHLYIDDLTMTDPIAQITFPDARVTLPEDIEPGEHTFLARLHDGTHKIVEPQVVLEKAFTVQ